MDRCITCDILIRGGDIYCKECFWKLQTGEKDNEEMSELPEHEVQARPPGLEV